MNWKTIDRENTGFTGKIIGDEQHCNFLPIKSEGVLPAKTFGEHQRFLNLNATTWFHQTSGLPARLIQSIRCYFHPYTSSISKYFQPKETKLEREGSFSKECYLNLTLHRHFCVRFPN